VVLLFVIGVLLLGAGVVLVLRGASWSSGGTAETLGQIESYGFAAAPGSDAGAPASNPFMGLAGSLGSLVQRVIGTGENGIRRQLLAAGMWEVEPATIVGYRVLAAAGSLALWIWLAARSDFAPAVAVLGAIAFAVVGWALPMMVLNRRARSRTDRIEYELPELIDLLVVTLEAGLSFLASLHMAAARLEGPLGEELRLALHEQRMGLTPHDALQGMLRRADTPSLRTFVRSVLQGEALGVSTGQIMRNLAVEMRKRRRAAAEERAQKAPIKMLFPLIFLIFPAMFIVLLGPAAYSVSKIFGD